MVLGKLNEKGRPHSLRDPDLVESEESPPQHQYTCVKTPKSNPNHSLKNNKSGVHILYNHSHRNIGIIGIHGNGDAMSKIDLAWQIQMTQWLHFSYAGNFMILVISKSLQLNTGWNIHFRLLVLICKKASTVEIAQLGGCQSKDLKGPGFLHKAPLESLENRLICATSAYLLPNLCYNNEPVLLCDAFGQH